MTKTHGPSYLEAEAGGLPAWAMQSECQVCLGDLVKTYLKI